MKEKIRQIVLSLGADVCGISNIDRFADVPKGFHPSDIYEGCKSVIVFGTALPKGVFQAKERMIYGYFNYDLCNKINNIAFSVCREMEPLFDCYAVPIPCDGPYEYWNAEKMEGHGLISMKHAAVKAGIGTLGKNTLLLNKQYGNRLVIGAVLTNLDLPSDPFAKNICIKNCKKCIENCPVQAIENGTVNQKRCRMNTYGTTEKGFETVDCNKCRTICPMHSGIEKNGGKTKISGAVM